MKTYGRSNQPQRSATKKRRVDEKDGTDAFSSAEDNLEYAIRESSAIVLARAHAQKQAAASSSSSASASSSSSSSSSSSKASDSSQSTHDERTGQEEDASSPPQLTLPPNTRKPTFAFLKRKRIAEEGGRGGTPLVEVTLNSVRSRREPSSLKQMRIDLGGNEGVTKTCPGCGMEYVPTNEEDAALHKKFHESNHHANASSSSGVDLGKVFMRANASRWVYDATRFDEGYVVIIDRKASPTARSQAKRVLEVVNRDLSSPEIPDDILWSQTAPSRKNKGQQDDEKTDRYRVFLHMKDSRCVGLCLAERIWESRPVDMETKGHAVVTKDGKPQPAIVGISRIWTSGSSRRKGIAMDLLDCVVMNFIYGMEIPLDCMAFSQPTESGRLLAEAFFEDEQWYVYDG